MGDMNIKNYSIVNDGAISYLKFDILDSEGITNACSCKWLIKDGKKEIFSFSKKQTPDVLKSNIDILLHALKIEPDHIAACHQVHGNDVVIVDDELNEHEEKLIIFDSKDAMITSKSNIMLIVTTADCVPIFLFDRKKRIIADVHAGWRSTHQNVLGNTIDTMKAKFGVDPRNLVICMGPAIGQCCFEVGIHVASLFKFDYGPQYLWFNAKSNKNHVDLKAVNHDIALSRGIPKENIHICDICTCCNEEFFSYRREGLVGLAGNVIMLN
jgi:polyphenol oxidase